MSSYGYSKLATGLLEGSIPNYVFCNGLRYVTPYHFRYQLQPKLRWIGKRVYDIFCKEFYAYDKFNFYTNAIQNGSILVNNQPIPLDYIFRKDDIIVNTVHRHESPVCADKIEIIDHNNEYQLIAANKPSSIPVHPGGRYRYNTLKWILYNQLNNGFDKYQTNKDLICYNIHRIDAVVSGLTLFTTNKNNIKYLQRRFAENEIDKIYIAKVNGNFPDYFITVNAPIARLPQKSKIIRNEFNNNDDDDDNDDADYVKFGIDNSMKGKHAVTEFMKISFDGKYSIIKCFPKTGRTHQIRVHLEYIGYPIANDIKYGGMYIIDNNEIQPYLDDNQNTLLNMNDKYFDKNCVECELIKKQIDGQIKSPFDQTRQIWLHAVSYKCDKDGWSFDCDLPIWAVPCV